MVASHLGIESRSSRGLIANASVSDGQRKKNGEVNSPPSASQNERRPAFPTGGSGRSLLGVGKRARCETPGDPGSVALKMAAATPELKVALEQGAPSSHFHYQRGRERRHEMGQRICGGPDVNGKRRIVIGALVPQSCLAYRVFCFHGIPLGKSLKSPATYLEDGSADGGSWCRGSRAIGLGGRAGEPSRPGGGKAVSLRSNAGCDAAHTHLVPLAVVHQLDSSIG